MVVINEKRCAVCDRYRCNDSDCETGCCQGHCTICELPVIAKACPECPEECSYHCKCEAEEANGN